MTGTFNVEGFGVVAEAPEKRVRHMSSSDIRQRENSGSENSLETFKGD
jgi:hypothetical protein